MSGHSKWSTIKRKKAAIDAKRGKAFTRYLKEVQIAAKLGGSNLSANPRLRTAVTSAKSQSVPNDNIERAIKRGSGELEGVDYEEFMYEGYGAGGVAVLVQALTENKNRTVAEVRHIFAKCNGSLASSNAVAYLFEQKGVFSLVKENVTEEELYEVGLDAGMEDLKDEGEVWEIYSPASEFQQLSDALTAFGKPFEGELRMVPTTMSKVTGKDAKNVLKLLDLLDDLDDVQRVDSNFDIDEEELAALNI